MDEHPVTQAALDITLQDLAEAEREIAHLRRELEQTKRENAWYRQQEETRRQQQQAAKYPRRDPWDISFHADTNQASDQLRGMSAAMVQMDEAVKLNDAVESQILAAIRKEPQDHLPRNRKSKK